MIIYNRHWLDNLTIKNESREWMRSGLITAMEFDDLKLKYQTPYNDSNIFIRAGMFVLTIIVISSAAGLYNVMIDIPLLGQLIISTIGLFASAEYFIQKKYYFRNGVTDALLYTGLSTLCFAIIMLIDKNNLKLNADPLVYLISVSPFFIYAAVRYADAFLALISFFLIIIINALLILKAGMAGKLILPFETMALSYLIYFSIRKLKSAEANRYWEKCLSMTEILSLSLFYLSGNYLVVRELSELLLNAKIPAGADISFAWFFYTFTILTPLIYIWRGLVRKDYILIRTGIILEVIGVISIKYYYSLLPPETAMMLGGFVIIGVAVISIKYLKTPKYGITYESDEIRNESADVLSSLVIAQAASNMHPPESHTRFGGGESGGGGAGGQF